MADGSVYRVRTGCVLPHQGVLLQEGTLVLDLPDRIARDHRVACLVDLVVDKSEILRGLRLELADATATVERLTAAVATTQQEVAEEAKTADAAAAAALEASKPAAPASDPAPVVEAVAPATEAAAAITRASASKATSPVSPSTK